jgi:DNA-binding response OmpR family regulator
MKEKILIIEDDEAINNLLTMNFQTIGYETESIFEGNLLAEHLASRQDYDLAILDIMLPGQDGFSLIPLLNAAQIPVICLTAKDDLQSKIQGLKSGAEDYLVKPFEMLELLVRIEKILKRHGKSEAIVLGDVHILIKERKVMRDNQEIYLKPMEFDCLKLLAQNKNVALTREEILKNLWGSNFEGETRTVDVHIARIRKKMNWHDVIHTIPRIGYRLEEPDEI